MPSPFDAESFMEHGRQRFIRTSMLDEKKTIAERQTAALERIAANTSHAHHLINLENISWGVRHREQPPARSNPVPLLLFGILVALIVIALKAAI